MAGFEAFLFEIFDFKLQTQQDMDVDFFIDRGHLRSLYSKAVKLIKFIKIDKKLLKLFKNTQYEL